jgi:nitrogen fixation/metabolism regulation signal transduction histidine kinase
VLSEEVVRRLEREGGLEGEVEVMARERHFVVQFAPLGAAVSGLVLAVNDVTESTRAARVLAWGEVASQVAHAIKNPLTPVRLGIQHLQRVRGSQPSQLPSALDETVGRLLAEIDRLDGIARAFSRFAAPGTPRPALESVQLAGVVGEAAALYQLVPGIEVVIEVPGNARGACRNDELKEVLLNLFDNARNAGAEHITVSGLGAYIEVVDDGAGIPAELLPRVFEPRFSSTSSGAGLGLAIVRRLVEGWGGTVSITSEVGAGTTVHMKLAEGNSL